MQTKQAEELVMRTPNRLCPACQKGKIHTKVEWRKYHPLAGTGFIVDVKLK